MIEFLTKNIAIIMTLLFLISELIGENPKMGANSVFGFIRDLLKKESLKNKPELDRLFEEPKMK
jgi:hypothetical protein